jgi:hypothetical protein
VYDLTTPDEGEIRARKSLSRRGKNRRGRRSTRGGRKRRAMAGAAPKLPEPFVSRFQVSERMISRRMRTFDYSRRLLDLAKRDDVVIRRLIDKINSCSFPHGSNLEGTGCRLCELRDAAQARKVSRIRHIRKWRDLRKGTHPGEPPFSVEMALEMELGGSFCRGNLAKLTRDRAVIVTTRPSGFLGTDSQGLKKWYCSRCERTTNVRICTTCGGELAPPTKKRTSERKHPLEGTSGSNYRRNAGSSSTSRR